MCGQLGHVRKHAWPVKQCQVVCGQETCKHNVTDWDTMDSPEPVKQCQVVCGQETCKHNVTDWDTMDSPEVPREIT
jgi:hypothetical protein